MILAGLLIVRVDNAKLPIKERASDFKIFQFTGIIIGVIGLVVINTFIPVFIYKQTGNAVYGFIDNTDFYRGLLILISISIFEEILFRRILVQKIKNVLGVKNAIWMSALIFAIVHVYTDSGLLLVFFSGLVLAYIYLRTNNIYFCIMAHLIYNLTVYFLTPAFAKNFDLMNHDSIMILSILIGSGLIYSMIRILNNSTDNFKVVS